MDKTKKLIRLGDTPWANLLFLLFHALLEKKCLFRVRKGSSERDVLDIFGK
jgi:hypothetical protein